MDSACTHLDSLVHNPGAESSKAPLMCNPIVDERDQDESYVFMVCNRDNEGVSAKQREGGKSEMPKK